MKNHILRFCYVTLICICTLACGNDAGDEGCSASELDQRQQVLTSTQNASIEAQIRHQNDPTAENCIAYRDAYMIYLEAFDRWLLCLDNHTKEQWVPVYEDAFQKLETIPC